MTLQAISTRRHAKAGDKKTVTGLHGSSQALLIAQCVAQRQHPQLLLVADSNSAQRLELEVASLLEQHDYPVAQFPDWETLPYDHFSPHQDIISTRLKTLYELPSWHQGLLIVPLTTLMSRLSPGTFLRQFSLIVRRGQKLDRLNLQEQLVQSGYLATAQVMEHGEFSVRGSLLDLFPMGSQTPYRIDFFDDEVDSIRPFDPDTQRSSQAVDELNLLPAREFPTDETAITLFRQQYRERFEVQREAESIYQQVSKGGFPAGIEYYLPLFFDATATLFDYLPEDTEILLYGDLHHAAEQFRLDLNERYEQRRHDRMRPLLPPTDLYLSTEQLFALCKRHSNLELKTSEENDGQFKAEITPLPSLTLQTQKQDPLHDLTDFIAHFSGRIVLIASSDGRREALLELLASRDLHPQQVLSLQQALEQSNKLSLLVCALEQGFILKEQDLAFITENEILGERVSQSRRRKTQRTTNQDSVIRNLAELHIGQAVVHLEHGVGRYLGLQTLEAGGLIAEYVTLEYASGSKLYVPVTALHLISRYSGGENPPLHKLGSDSWSKAKQRAAEKIRDVAAELLDIYAKRKAQPGHQYRIERDLYAQFCASFPFEETPDQQACIEAVLDDMKSDQPMDRLVCGDVGFGKTEVAMRAAFVAVQAGHQVAMLVPTTLLAQQHYDNFRDRFANWPIRIEVLSRFKNAKEQKAILEAVESGQVDILIGTHKLLGNSINFNALGLLIVDEEHRFGVRQKEKIKALRANVDLLTLTATPIPRTLNMAMHAIRDLSIIATPPAKRLAIKTFVHQNNDALIREAILRELKRGGQIYYLHNNVETIEKCAAKLAELLPEARINVAHGQMRERELERVMSDFYHQRHNLLVCTTIIETGIDVPTANTIIMDRADLLGLAQLHQLRGRVGRSHHQAYAYLLTPHPKRMTADARKRLEAITSLEDLGAGFTLATHDLEIRGAGELLGEDQSGQMQSVGFTLYMEMLERAVEALKDGREPALEDLLSKQCEVELKLPALIPDSYIPDVNLRLSIYKQIASCSDQLTLDETQVELIDRFGLLPDATKNLITLAAIKIEAATLGIRRIEASERGGVIEFAPHTRIDPGYLVSLLQRHPESYRLDGPNRLKFTIPSPDRRDRIKLIQSHLRDFAANAA